MTSSGTFHDTMELRFSTFVTLCITRNAPLELEFQAGRSEDPGQQLSLMFLSLCDVYVGTCALKTRERHSLKTIWPAGPLDDTALGIGWNSFPRVKLQNRFCGSENVSRASIDTAVISKRVKISILGAKHPFNWTPNTRVVPRRRDWWRRTAPMAFSSPPTLSWERQGSSWHSNILCPSLPHDVFTLSGRC